MDNNIDLVNKIEKIKNKSEEKIFLLEEKLNELGNDINKLIENYQNNEYNIYNINNNNDNILSLQQDIIDYISKERENSINDFNNVFYKIIENVNQKNNSKENENIKNILINIRKEFLKKSKEIMNKIDESEYQSKDIDNIIKTQMFEQFENINNRIIKELLVDNNEKENIINYTQNYLKELKKHMKLEKLQK